MTKHFKADGDGNIVDHQCTIVGKIAVSDPAVLATIVFRLNLFDDMLRAISLLQVYPYEGAIPSLAKKDVDMTYQAARTAA